jgi:hypothetical protein
MILSITASLIANAISNLLERARMICVIQRWIIQINSLSNYPTISKK